MKRLRSSDDLDSYGEKSLSRSSSHRSFYYNKSNEVLQKGLPSSSSRYDRDRSVDDESRESSRIVRKRPDHDLDGIDRRKNAGFDRYTERKGYGGDFGDRDGYSGYRGLIHRTDSLSSSKREFPKGYRSQRDRSRHEGSVSSSSWQRIGSMGRDFDESRGSRGSFIEERERKGLRDVRSPSLSGSEQSKKGFRDSKARDVEKEKSSPSMSRGDSGNEYLSKSRSPSNRLTDQKVKKEERSPSCSSEQRSRSVEPKKVEDAPLEGAAHSSEMEEGELEPEAKDVSDPGNCTGENIVAEGADGDSKNGDPVEAVKAVNGEDIDKSNVDVEANGAVKDEKEVQDRAREEDQLNSRSGSRSSSSSCDTESVADAEGSKEEVITEAPIEQEQVQTEKEPKEDKGTCLEVKAVEETTVPVVPEEKRVPEVPLEDTNVLLREDSTLNFMDKGKSVAEPIDILESAEVGSSIKEKSRDVVSSKEIYMEGSSSRGFELFSNTPARKPEKSDQSGQKKEEKQALEPLDLSLSLPNVLLPIGAQDTSAAPGSPSQARSVQSWSTFQSNSEGFSMSMSFSGSQSYFHNPSCSLTQNSMDYEHSVGKSVGSRPLFQGVDWEALAQNDVKPKEVPLYQRIMANGNGSHQPSVGETGNSNDHILQGLRAAAEGTSKIPKLLERQLIFNKHIQGGQSKVHEDVKSPAQSVGSHEIGPSYTFERKKSMPREKHGGSSSLYRSPSQKEEQIWFGGADFVEAIVEKIVKEPILDMTRKFHEMRGDLVAKLKEGVREIMLNSDKRGQLLDFQRSLQNRSDITIDMLLNSHRAQLEILVALKTGLAEYLQPQSSTSPSYLAEIFLNQRCRNLNCRYALPVNDCDCKVCGTKNGFCSDCMCLVCSRFDMASNTCKWVGCDICLHWCHVDCALRESLIRNGQSATSGQTEMQFHCIACDHPSEMFGFVKEVFLNFLREWSAENLSRELEYVKRVFRGSKDMRGRRLFEVADQLLVRLGNKNNLADARNLIMNFFNESDPAKFSNTHLPSSNLDQPKATTTGVTKQKDMPWMKSVYLEKNPLHLDHPSTAIPSSSIETNNKPSIAAPDLQRSTSQKPLFDELDSIIRIKQAEASMFQSRADDARREAEGLKRIALAKNEKIEEEYSVRVAKLRLAESEETRKQKFEELQGLERAHREYFNMKIRMEADIKDLLLKMEATKRNLAI